MLTTTPKNITKEILEFCSQISEVKKPIYLKVQTLPTSKKLECFENVKNYIAQNGGSIQYGWRIWEWEGIMVEAEFHSVWVSHNGELIDITPANEKEVLFLPDNSSSYEGKTLNNIRSALINNLLVREFVDINNQISQLRIKGKTANKDSQMFLLYLLAPLAQRQEQLLIQIADKYLNLNSVCFCGSGEKYKKCHKGKVRLN